MTGEDVAGTQAGPPLPAQLGEHPISGGVPGTVVDLLEAVEVEHRDRQRRARAVGDRTLAGGEREEAAAVEQPGERVGVGALAQAFAEIAEHQRRWTTRCR